MTRNFWKKKTDQQTNITRKLMVILSFLGVLILWQIIAVIIASVKPELNIFFPSPQKTFTAACRLLAAGDYWTDIMITNYRVLLGFGLSVVTAIPLGILMGTFPGFRGMLGPLTDFIRYIPVATLVPMLIVWAGVGDLQKILLLYIGTFFQMLVLVTDAVRRVPIFYIDSAMTLGANSRNIITKIILPASLPQIYDACRVSIGLTWSYVLLAEIVASERGIGYYIIRSQRFLQMDNIFVSIIILGLVGLMYDMFFIYTREIFFSWALDERREDQ